MNEKRRSFLRRTQHLKNKYEIFVGEGEWFWRLVGGNGEIVAQSEGYGSRADALRGAKDCKDVARHARFVLVPEPSEPAA